MSPISAITTYKIFRSRLESLSRIIISAPPELGPARAWEPQRAPRVQAWFASQEPESRALLREFHFRESWPPFRNQPYLFRRLFSWPRCASLQIRDAASPPKWKGIERPRTFPKKARAA